MAHPTSASSSITTSVLPKNSAVQITSAKMPSVKLIKPQDILNSVVTSTIGSTEYLTATVPLNSLLNKSDPSSIQLQAVTHESSSVTVPITSSMQHTSTIVPSLDSSIMPSLYSSIMPLLDSSIMSSLDSSVICSDDEIENTFALNKDGYFIWDHKTTMLFFREYEHQKKLQKRKYQSKEAMFQAIAESFQKRGFVNATKNHMKNKFILLKKKWDKYIKRTTGKNSTGKGTKPLPYKDEMIKIFGKSHSGVPIFVDGRNEIVSREEILQRVDLSLSENENEEQSSIALHSPLSTLSGVNSECQSIGNSSRSSVTGSSCSSLINAKPKVRDGKLALALQSVEESICSALQKEGDAKQETRVKVLTELQKCNELQTEQLRLQKERNSILRKQLRVLERMGNKMIYPT